MVKKILGIFIASLLLAILLSRFMAFEGDPELKARGLFLLRKERPFTGVVFRFHKFPQLAFFATYRRGKPDGWEIRWFANGRKASERSFQDGTYNGISQTWYESGKIKSWRNYSKGLAEGEQWAWGPGGQVLEYNLYQRDQEIAHKTWTFDGRPFHNYVYQNAEKVGLEGEPFCKRRKFY